MATKPTWKKLLADHRVALEPTSKKELDELRAMAATNLKDAAVRGVSAQGRYEFAYNAARIMATIVVRACGYRVAGRTGHHYFTFQALQVADPKFAKVAAYFDRARDKRNDFSYDSAIHITETEAEDLLKAVKQFSKEAEDWIFKHHPSLAT